MISSSHLPHTYLDPIKDLLNVLDSCDKNWVKEIQTLERIWLELNKPSVRNLSTQTNKSKSWCADSLKLAIGLRVYPWLDKEESRTAALRFVDSRKKTLKYLKG